MPNRSAKFASAIFASLLAGAAFATISHGPADAADDCLSGPKGETPEGSHWYYRVDRVTKRHCWYLREGGEKSAQAAPSASASSARPTVAKADATMQRSVADARAEFSAQTRFEQPKRADEPATAVSADPTTSEIYRAAPLPGAATPESVVASRWPDSSAAPATAEPAPVKRNAVADVKPPTQARTPTAIAEGAAADASSQTPAYSVQMQVAALMAALALAGFLGIAIFKFAGPKRSARANLRARRAAGTMWEPTDDDRIVLAADPETDTRARRRGFARKVERGGNADERIAEFFSQLSRRAPT
jgi:hypothetical protein